MNDDVSRKVVTFNSEIAPKVSGYHIPSSNLPFVARVELLVGETLPTKGSLTYNTPETQVLKPFLQGAEARELSVRSDHLKEMSPLVPRLIGRYYFGIPISSWASSNVREQCARFDVKHWMLFRAADRKDRAFPRP